MRHGYSPFRLSFVRSFYISYKLCLCTKGWYQLFILAWVVATSSAALPRQSNFGIISELREFGASCGNMLITASVAQVLLARISDHISVLPESTLEVR